MASSPENPFLTPVQEHMGGDNDETLQVLCVAGAVHDEKYYLEKSKLRLDEQRKLYPKFGELEFGISLDELKHICNFDNREVQAQLDLLYEEWGGPGGISYLLKSDLSVGLNMVPDVSSAAKVSRSNKVDVNMNSTLNDVHPEDIEARKDLYGVNRAPIPKSATIFELIWETIKEDPIIKILIFGAVIVLILATIMCPPSGWSEGIAILIAVVIVLGVTAGNDYSKDKKFKKLLMLQSDKKVKVIRGGIEDQISSWEIVVGDVVHLQVGDEIPADGILISTNRLIIDESPLTGESKPVRKGLTVPYLFSGCQVSEGSATYLVLLVGPSSTGGQIQELLSEAQNEETVLQTKLKVVAVLIGKIGLAAGVLTFLGLATRWGINWAQKHPISASCPELQAGTIAEDNVINRLIQLVEYFIIGITVIVVAVPEGLPMAVTISLAFSMFKMMQDKCFVRHLDASETMGEATCICTDKTGTLTENRMTVVKCLFGQSQYHGDGSGSYDSVPFTKNTLPFRLRSIVTEGIAVNSTCFIKRVDYSQPPIFVGPATEGAMLIFGQKLGCDYEEMRKCSDKIENAVWPFSSDRKRMSTLIPKDLVSRTDAKPRYRLYTKGASEIILGLCTRILSGDGAEITELSAPDVSQIQRAIKKWASEGLRTVALAYNDLDTPVTNSDHEKDPENDLIWIGLLAIKDPVRAEVPDAVAKCQRAGLTIRMVTGDNILTACKIASECGILFNDGVALEGPIFRSMSEEEKKAIIPRLQVLARSSPGDKHTLVNLLKKMGEVVAVTGDGTNDAPALKEADVGFSMGISGTQIAMNASDIVLLDDNFASLVQSIRWGRNVLNSVRKFLQFQLCVNLTAIIVTFVGSVSVGESPLSTVQLLWVNLIMDSLGALALATDDPEVDILDHPPHAKDAHLISIPMIEYIFVQVVYQTTTLLTILFIGNSSFDTYMYPETIKETASQLADTHSIANKHTTTIVFATFIYLQVANIIMARQLNGELNLFRSIFKNIYFVAIVVIIITVQLLTVTFGGNFIKTVPLKPAVWGIIIAITAGNMIFTFIVRVISKFFRKATSVKLDRSENSDETDGETPIYSKGRLGVRAESISALSSGNNKRDGLERKTRRTSSSAQRSTSASGHKRDSITHKRDSITHGSRTSKTSTAHPGRKY